jgi:hypothetical protein
MAARSPEPVVGCEMAKPSSPVLFHCRGTPKLCLDPVITARRLTPWVNMVLASAAGGGRELATRSASAARRGFGFSNLA